MAGILDRDVCWNRVGERRSPWDFVVIGGGATGAAIALDAASRGFDVALFEQSDFGKGTSSRSTKLVHGGVRYLQQGNITLVRDALRERALLHENAPHLVHDQQFLVPCRSLGQRLFYGTGLKLYDLLAGRANLGASYSVSSARAASLIPNLRIDQLKGGVIYHDGQFDDSRLLINMLQTAAEHGACPLNYARVHGLQKSDAGVLSGVEVSDRETSTEHLVPARCVINATGPFCDSVRRMDDPHSKPILAASQGVHVVLPKRFLSGETAVIVPRTADGRVIFIIPWHQKVLVGTTDTPIDAIVLEPTAQAAEIDFLLSTAGEYLSTPPRRADVLSVFTGIRPLVRSEETARTAALSRDHVIRISDSGLVNITGGKWTTVRHMAEDCVNQAIAASGLEFRKSVTKSLRLHGATDRGEQEQPYTAAAEYGSDARRIEELAAQSPRWAETLCAELQIRGADVVWAVRHEMARTLDDVLARRTRALFLDSKAAVAVAPRVVALMAEELGWDAQQQQRELSAFQQIAAHYQLPPE